MRYCDREARGVPSTPLPDCDNEMVKSFLVEGHIMQINDSSKKAILASLSLLAPKLSAIPGSNEQRFKKQLQYRKSCEVFFVALEPNSTVALHC